MIWLALPTSLRVSIFREAAELVTPFLRQSSPFITKNLQCSAAQIGGFGAIVLDRGSEIKDGTLMIPSVQLSIAV